MVNLRCFVLSGRTQDHRATYYDSLYVTFSECQDYRDIKLISLCQGLGVGKRLTTRGCEGTFLGL